MQRDGGLLALAEMEFYQDSETGQNRSKFKQCIAKALCIIQRVTFIFAHKCKGVFISAAKMVKPDPILNSNQERFELIEISSIPGEK